MCENSIKQSNVQHFQQSMDQPGAVAIDPARDQLMKRKNVFSYPPFVPENLVSRDWFGIISVQRQPARSAHTQTESDTESVMLSALALYFWR